MYVDILIILIISLIPLIWIWGGYVILGHDAGKPLDPQVHFIDRLSTWTHRYGIGADQTFALAGFFIHGYEYVLSMFGLSPSIQQGLEYVTYFMAMGFSMYFFAITVFPNNRYGPIAMALFYEVNHFVLQGWFIVERTKFTLYIALPLILLQIIKINSKSTSPLRAGILTSLILLVLNGGGFLPLYGSILVVGSMFILLVWWGSEKKIESLVTLIKYITYVILFSIIFQSYWLFPYAYYIYRDFGSEIVKYGGASVEQWIASISEFASFTNLLRLQGIQEWYINTHHPYAKFFLNNIFLSFISYLLPLAAFGAILISHRKDRYTLIVFAVIALVSMFFMAGSHAPLGWLYLLLIKHIPGFIAFRTPYYKFATGLWLSYAILIGYWINYIFTNRFPKIPPIIVYLFITVCIVGYSFPIVGVNFFSYGKNLTNRVKVPQYVYDYGKWAQSPDNKFNRILILPPHKSGSLATDLIWGYWSLAPINSLLDAGSYIDQNLTLSPEEAQIVSELYRKIEARDGSWKQDAKKLNIDGVLLQTDFTPYMVDRTLIEVSEYEKFLARYSVGRPIVFGQWKIYRIYEQLSPVDVAVGYYDVSYKDGQYNDTILNRITQQSLPNSAIMHGVAIDKNINDLKIADIVLPECSNCLLLEQIIGPKDHNIINLPGSKFYFLKIWFESYQSKYASSDIKRAEMLTYHITKRLYEYDNMYVFNLPLNKKHSTIDKYLQDVAELKSTIVRVNKLDRSFNDKDVIIKIYNTLLVHLRSLANYIENDYDPELTERLILVEHQINEITNIILNKNVFSTEVSVKKYTYNLPSAGGYEIFLHTPSVSMDENDHKGIELSMGNNEKHILVDRSTLWQSLGEFHFDKDDSLLEIKEKDVEVLLTESSPVMTKAIETYQDVVISGNNHNKKKPCLTIPMNTLGREKYLFNLQLATNKDTKIWTFLIDSKTASEKVDRKFGNYTKMRKGKDLNIDLKLQVAQPEYFSYTICQFDDINDSIEPISIKSLKISRITNPLLYFIRKNSSFIPSTPRDIRMSKISNTKYEFSVSKGSRQLLLLDQRYNHNWFITHSLGDIPAMKVNGFQNGWIMPASTIDSNNIIRYSMQEIFLFFSAVSIIGIATSICYVYSKR
jgi:hypothetical protein